MEQPLAKELMRRFLLGELAEAEHAAIEEEVFSEKEKFHQLREVEDSLVDAYARGQLSGAERLNFEQRYLANPARRRHMEFAQAMTAELDRQESQATAPQASETGPRSKPEKYSWWTLFANRLSQPKFALALSCASIALLLTGSVWLYRQAVQLQTERAARSQRERDLEQQLAAERARNQDLLAKLAPPASPPTVQPTVSPSPPPSAFVTFAITVGGLRDGSSAPTKLLIIQPGIQQVRLQLHLSRQDYRRYQATLRDADNREIRRARNLIAISSKPGTSIFLSIPAQKLASGAYILSLEGIGLAGEAEPVGKTQFNIEKK